MFPVIYTICYLVGVGAAYHLGSRKTRERLMKLFKSRHEHL